MRLDKKMRKNIAYKSSLTLVSCDKLCFFGRNQSACERKIHSDVVTIFHCCLDCLLLMIPWRDSSNDVHKTKNTCRSDPSLLSVWVCLCPGRCAASRAHRLEGEKKPGAALHRTSIGSNQALASVPKIRTRRSRDASGDAGESVIVTGTHAFNRKARDSAVPVTVVSAATLRRSGQLNLADAITRVDPSITVTANGADAGALTSAIRMRGLNPNEVSYWSMANVATRPPISMPMQVPSRARPRLI